MGAPVTLLSPTALGLLAGSGYLDLSVSSSSGRSVAVVAASLLRYEMGLGLGPRSSRVLRDAGLFADAGSREHDQLLDSQIVPFTGWRELGRRGGDLAVDAPRGAIGTWVARHRENQGITCSALCERVARATLTDATLLRPQLEELESGRSWTPRAPSFIRALGLETEVVLSFGDAVGGVARALSDAASTGELEADRAHAPASTHDMVEKWLQSLSEPACQQTDPPATQPSEGAPDGGVSVRQELRIGSAAGEAAEAHPDRDGEERAPTGRRYGSGTHDGTSLSELRAAARLSQTHVAKALGLSAPACVWLWETGRRPLPAGYLGPIAELYGVDRSDIEAVAEVSVGPPPDELSTANGRHHATLAELRSAACLLPSEVAEALGLSSSARVSQWETRRHPLPRVYLAQLAALYGVDEETIEAAREAGERPPPPPQDTADPRGDTPLGQLRAAAGLSESDVARALGVGSPAHVSLWETGRQPLPPRNLAPLAGLYGVDQAAIEAVAEVGERPPPPPQDVSGHRGHAVRTHQRAEPGHSLAPVAEALGLSSPPRVPQGETGRDALRPREVAPSAGLLSIRRGGADDASGEESIAFDQLAGFDALQGVRIAAVELSTRLRNVLQRLGIDCFGELRGMTIDDFRQVSNVGTKTGDELVGLMDGSRSVTWMEEEPRLGDAGHRPGRWAAHHPGYIPAPWEPGEPEALREDDLVASRVLMRDLGEVAAWWTANRGQAKLPELFRAEPDDSMPPSVLAAFERLQETTVRELAEPELLAAHDPVVRFEAAVLSFDDRVRDVLVRRAGREPETLESIGTSHQVTRERIRQLEAQGQRAVDELLDSDKDVTDRLPELRAMLHPIATEELLEEVILAAFPGIPACDTGTVDLFRSAIVRRVGDLRDWHEGWLTPRWLLPALAAARRGRYDGQSLESLRTRLGHTDRSAVPITTLLDLLGLTEVDGIIRRRPAGLPARAIAELEAEEKPLAFDVLLDRLGPDVNHRSLRNALMSDELIVRSDRDVFALAEWGLQTYEPISDMIARHLTAHGGSSTMDAVIGDLTSRFSVAASSVRAYVRSDRFVELPDGTFRERTEADAVDEQLRPLRAHAGCVRIDGCWAYRVPVDEQLLSGYSAPVPTSFAAHLGLRPLESRLLASQLGTDVSVTRKGLNPMLGRLRPVAQQLGLGPGSLLFVIGPDRPGRPLSFIGYEAERLGEASPRERAGLQLGLEPSFGIGDVLRALDLDGEPPQAAVALLRARGEDDLADAFGTDRAEVEEGPTTDAVARLLGF